MTAKVGSLNVDLTLETARFQKGLRDAQQGIAGAQRNLTGLGGTLGSLSKQMASVGAIFAGSALVGGLAKAAVDGLKYASSLGEVAKQLGVTTTELQEYRYVASQTGVEQGEMDKALQKLTRTVGEAAKGSGSGAKAFKELGINIRDANGNMKTAGQLIPEIAGALQKVPSEAEKARLQVALFGRAGQQLGPMLAEGAKGINNMRNAAREMGLVLDEKMIANADEAADKLNKLQQVLQMKITAAVVEKASEIDALATSLLNLVTRAGDAVKAWRLWKNELAIRMNENTANGWFTSDAEKAAAEARIRKLRGERQEIENPGVRVLSPGAGMVKPAAPGSNKINRPINMGPGSSWTGRPGAPAALKRTANLSGGSSFRSSFQQAMDAAGTGTGNWYEQGRRLAVEIGMDSGIAEKILKDIEAVADKADTTKVQVVRSFKEMADGTIGALQNLSSAIRGGDFLSILGSVIGLATQLGTIGAFGKKVQTNLSKPIPGYAGGTSFHPGGLAIVGERGPELLHLPRGSAVTPNHKLGGGNTFVLQGNLMTPEFWKRIQQGDIMAADAGGRVGQTRTAYRNSRRLA